jgi:pimeloyl-ACP methyl ester carboxylesterase
MIAVWVMLALGPTSPLYAQGQQAVAVFAADGAGNFKAASSLLRQVVEEDALLIEVHAFEWSHGYCRILSDQVTYGHNCDRGRRLADEVLSFHASHPETPIYLYAHSAGCAVAMKALESLPPGIVERAILLSPSLSSAYDLRPALEHVCTSLHVFYSRWDWGYLGMTMRLVGTADRWFGWCSGRFGFDVDADYIESDLLAKLHQRAWEPEDRALGNNGGHFGNYQPAFLRAHIIPLLHP